MARYMFASGNFEVEYEIVQGPERKIVSFGVDIAKLADCLEEEMAGQKRLPGGR